MQTFEYTITDPYGMHARPAGMLVREASRFNSDITLEKDGQTADAKRIFSVMGLGVKSMQTIKVRVNGSDEKEAAGAVKVFLENNM